MKIFYLRRRWLAVLAGAAACAAIYAAAAAPGAMTASASAGQAPIRSVQRDQKQTAVTFDVAQDDEGEVAELLELLDGYHVTAAFFVTGEWAQQHPDAVRALREAGHEVMGRLDTGVRYTRLTAEEIIADITDSCDQIEALTGAAPTLIRCPDGTYDDHVLAAIRSMGREAVQWDVDSLDGEGASAGEISRQVMEHVEPGSILLFHSGGPHTKEALPVVLEQLLREGYEIVPLSQLLLEGDYVVDGSGRQCPA